MTTGRSDKDYPGSFIPFDKPLASPPTALISDDPLVSLCINESWIPYILGAIKAVGRPETWKIPMSDIDHVAGEIAYLMGSVRDGCGVIVPAILCVSGDFKDLPYNTEAGTSFDCASTRGPVVGWEGCHDATLGLSVLDVVQTFSSPSFVHSYRVTGTVGVEGGYSVTITLFLNNSIVASDNFLLPQDVGYDHTLFADVVGDKVEVQVEQIIGVNSPVYTFQSFELCYLGAFPLSVPPDTWVHDFDFTTTNGGGFLGTVNFGTYTSGVGWVSAVDGNPSVSQLRVWINASQFLCTRIELTFSITDIFGTDQDIARGFANTEGGSVLLSTPATLTDHSTVTDYTAIAEGAANIRSVYFGTDAHSAGGGQMIATKLRIRGIGFNPFA